MNCFLRDWCKQRVYSNIYYKNYAVPKKPARNENQKKLWKSNIFASVCFRLSILTKRRFKVSYIRQQTPRVDGR